MLRYLFARLLTSLFLIGVVSFPVFASNSDIFPPGDDAKAAFDFDGKGFINMGRHPELLKGCMGIWLPSCWVKADENTLVVFDEEGAKIDQASIQIEPAARRKSTVIP